ncbi:hypothetical protein TNCV_5116271 [Trichonephila clavipes]|nr:hypothetical protein TNCV_5116271 [Trichonephila clavipes]
MIKNWVTKGEVKSSARNGRRDPKCPSAKHLRMVFEKTQGPLMKVLPVPGWRSMKQLAVRVYLLRCSGLLDDWSVKNVLSLVVELVAISNPLGARKPKPGPFDFSAKECQKPNHVHQITVPGKCPNSPEDEQVKQGQTSKDFTTCTKGIPRE